MIREKDGAYDVFPNVWKGAMGAAMFSTDERGYVHVDYWIPSECTAHLPPYEEPAPK